MGGPVLFIGETLVDLICERPVSDWSEAGPFVPHCGGAPTNAAIVAARCGAAVALGGGVGDDQWGALARGAADARNGSGCEWWARLPGVQTAVAFDVIDEEAVPDFLIYGRGNRAGDAGARAAASPRRSSSCAAIELGSNTLHRRARARRCAEQARSLALREGKPVIVDVNLRLHRWPDPQTGADVVREFVRGRAAREGERGGGAAC